MIARSDGTVECGFCLAAFTVQVQPQYPAFPQTVNGVPMQVPGMGPVQPGEDPNGQTAQQGAQGVPVDEEAQDGPEAEDEPEDDAEGQGDGNPFAKASYRTASGALLSEDQFLRHIALTAARDPKAMAQRIKNRKRGRA